MAALSLSAVRIPTVTVRSRRASVAVKAQVQPAGLATPHLIKDLGRTAVGVAAGLLLAVSPAFASPDLALGEEVFEGNCAACHAGGGNSVVAGKTLAKEALESYLDGGYNEAAIIYQVTNGKGAMPAWGDRLSEEEIESVAAYVFKSAGAGW